MIPVQHKCPRPIFEDSPLQKCICAVPFVGEIFAHATRKELLYKVSTTRDPERLRELKRIEKDYIIADSLRYCLYFGLFLHWYTQTK